MAMISGTEPPADALRRWRILQPHIEDGIPLTQVATAAGVPLRTVRRWLARYRANGLIGITRPTRADRGRRRIPDDLVALIEGLALRRPAPTAAQVHRQVTAVAAEQGWPGPAYATVYAIIRGVDRINVVNGPPESPESPAVSMADPESVPTVLSRSRI